MWCLQKEVESDHLWPLPGIDVALLFSWSRTLASDGTLCPLASLPLVTDLPCRGAEVPTWVTCQGQC